MLKFVMANLIVETIANKCNVTITKRSQEESRYIVEIENGTILVEFAESNVNTEINNDCTLAKGNFVVSLDVNQKEYSENTLEYFKAFRNLLFSLEG